MSEVRARVLVADDEPSIRFVLRESLEEEGCEVVDVEDGDRALEELSSGRFHIAFLDIRMPGQTGLDLLEQLTATGADVARFMKDDTELDCQFLNSITAVDFIDRMEIVYHLTSLNQQHTAVLKTELSGRDSLAVPSVYGVWRGADFQEREVWDLMGVHFEGHPNMKRIMLW